MWALSTCGEPNDIKKNTHPENVTTLFSRSRTGSRPRPRRPRRRCPLHNAPFRARGHTHAHVSTFGRPLIFVRAVQFFERRSIHFRLLVCRHATCGPSVTADELFMIMTKSRKVPTGGLLLHAGLFNRPTIEPLRTSSALVAQCAHVIRARGHAHAHVSAFGRPLTNQAPSTTLPRAVQFHVSGSRHGQFGPVPFGPPHQ